jgi:hypothetical protein
LGKVTIRDAPEAEVAATRLERALHELKAGRVERADSQIQFTGGVFRSVSNLNLLVPVDSGELYIEPSSSFLTIRYRLRFTQMFVLVSVMVLILFVPILVSAPSLPGPDAIVVPFLVWLGLYGGNVAISIVRFPGWIQEVVTGKC